MPNLRILNSREKKRLIEALEGECQASFDSLKTLQILQGGSEYHATTTECLSINLQGLRIDSIGLRIARKTKEGINSTIHATQLFIQNPRKTVELDENQAKEFIQNRETPAEKPDGQYIITHKQKPVDSGTIKDKKLKRN